MTTKPPETRRVEVDLKALTNLADQLRTRAHPRPGEDYYAGYRQVLRAMADLAAALASGADTPDGKVAAEQRLRAVEAERDELKEANTSLIHDIRALQEAASPPAPDPALHEFALDLGKGVAHWGEDCPKFDDALVTSTSYGLPIKGFMLCECVVDALRTPAPTREGS